MERPQSAALWRTAVGIRRHPTHPPQRGGGGATPWRATTVRARALHRGSGPIMDQQGSAEYSLKNINLVEKLKLICT